MAFPVPTSPQDVSSSILSKLDDANNKSLNAQLAASWIHELDESIDATKKSIHERIYDNLPLFEQQEASSKSVQIRLHSLSRDVDCLVDKLSNPHTGLAPILVRTLSEHAALSQQTSEANVLHNCLDHLLRFRTELSSLDILIRDGKLREAVAAYTAMDNLLAQHPPPLARSKILVELKSKFRTMRSRAEDQLSDAYNRSVLVSSDTLMILQSVTVRQSHSNISFSDILSALSPSALLNHLTVLRRDIVSLYIVRLLEKGFLLKVDAQTVTCSPSTHYDPNSALDNVGTILTFLSTHLFFALPRPHDAEFRRLLRKSLAQSVLNNLLIPCLPSVFEGLPVYLALLQKAVAFESKFVSGMLAGDKNELVVENWANGVAGHYERQRRQMILDSARTLFVMPYPKNKVFLAEVELPASPQPSATATVPVQGEEVGLFAQQGGTSKLSEDVETDGWGFDDEIDAAPQPEANGHGKAEADPSDAWGWNDDDETVQDDDTWDDPWANPPADDPPDPPIISAKVANGLVKKDKKRLNGDSSPMPSPSLPHKPPEKRPPSLAPLAPPPMESYVVSSQMTDILKIIEDVLDEGAHLASSHVFSGTPTSGNLLMNTAPAVIDLFRAVHPVAFGKELKTALDAPIRFSNNCLYLSGELETIDHPVVKEKMKVIRHRLKVLGDSWLDETIDRQSESVDSIIAEGAAGFTFTADQDRYDECEAALSRALQDIRVVATQWRGLLTKSKYYSSIGAITEAALSRVVHDITALPDIPELESQRLSELCKIFHALEGLFVEDPEEPSFVVAYVPSWLKFSYLSELLEASMADIKYLFEEGALVDFEVEELASLVRALFADTPLRTETINRFMGGHPVMVS